jgi:hypothetical protein
VPTVLLVSEDAGMMVTLLDGIEAAGLKALEGSGPRRFGELVELTRGGEDAE